MSMLRFKVAKEAFSRKAVPVNEPKERPSEYFGKYVFNREKMFKYLPKKTYEAVIEAIDNSTPLSREVADSVAAGMRKWALEMGATHYTHWFHPLTDGTAEKHDSFIEHDGKGGGVEEFSASIGCPERYSPVVSRSSFMRSSAGSSGIFGMGYIFSCIHSR
mgnify:CR=1 FL=1